jgi:hypothetical protein
MPVKYATAYPPASGPKNPGNPGLMACGVVALLGVFGLTCCGGVSWMLVRLVDQPLAMNQPLFPPGNVNPPPGIPPFDFPQPKFPAIPAPQFPEIPKIEPVSPFEPVSPGPVPPIEVPGIPSTPPESPAATPKTVDEFIQALNTVDVRGFKARPLLEQLNALPVEEARRVEVVEAVLGLLKRSGVYVGGLLAGPGEEVLEKWAGLTQATRLAQFAAADTNHNARREVLLVIAKIGGDAETAKALLPLLSDASLVFVLPNVFAKIGPEAEDVLLAHLDVVDQRGKHALYDSLGKVGGAKSKAKLQSIVSSGKGIDRGLGGKALREIEAREAGNK